MNQLSVSFMNSYHTNNDLDYISTLSGWDEHIAITRKGKGVDIDKDGKFDFYTNSSSVKQFKRTDLRFNTSNNNKELKTLMQGTTLTSPESMFSNRFNKFSRYGYLDPTHELVTGTREYLFFSKPDLNLVNTSAVDSINPILSDVPFFNEAFNRYKLSYYSLQQYYSNNNRLNSNGFNIDLRNKYINLLSNMVTSSFDLSDISATDVLNNQNLYQVNTSYREGSLPSDLQYDFSLEFKDTKYLDVYMLFKIYDEYFRYKYMLEISPTRYDYIVNKIYPEALSIWKIITDDTGRIMYWAKATGCTPMSVPRGTISNIEGNIKFTINWKAQFIKDMDPINLSELNYLTASSMNRNLASDTFNDCEIMPISNNETWVGYPLIINGEGATLRSGHYPPDNVSSKKKMGFHRLVWVNEKTATSAISSSISSAITSMSSNNN